MLLLPACLPRPVPPRVPSGPEGEARAYLDAWANGDLQAQRDALAEVPADFDAQHARWRQGLGVVASRFERLSVVSQQEGAAIVGFRAVHTLRGLGDWEVDSLLSFVRREGRWRVRWTPAVLHSEARPGDGFSRVRTWGPRAPLLDARGEPLTVPGEVISIGVEPRKVEDPAEVAEALFAQVGLERGRVEAALKAASARPDAFVGLIDVRPERYRQVRSALAPVPGIFFRKKTARLSPAEGFAAHTLGRVGEVTAEALEALGFPYQAGDVVGLSGLERAFERRLAGRPSGEVRLTRASGETLLLRRFEGEEGTPVRTTLRRDVQTAAEAALSGITQPAALVAVDAASGEVLAVVSRPLGEPLHRAMTGRYPPGSTFKVVTTEALLASGVRPDARISCPAEAAAGGKRFRNFEGEVLGDTSLRMAFAHSCNTAFIQLGARLEPGALGEAARRFGFW
ncbi:MAG TPA: penicillin-binding transpeptidase domain-containing protein, partial [Longimicrobium sp.]|nr:penicillin-binding transpeptidase domain-containing protein [Longimicrobium sp.]